MGFETIFGPEPACEKSVLRAVIQIRQRCLAIRGQRKKVANIEPAWVSARLGVLMRERLWGGPCGAVSPEPRRPAGAAAPNAAASLRAEAGP